MRRGTRLDSLTSLRFFAALLVVVHHSVVNDVHRSGLTAIPGVRDVATLGYTGVSFFFVLSGFVLTWSWVPDRTRGRFWRLRVARVYPLHLATWCLSIPLLLWLGQTTPPATAVPNLLLVQAWSPNSDVVFGMNAPSWSLSDEAAFYLVFPWLVVLLARFAPRWRLAALGCLAVLVSVPVVVYGLGGRDAIAVLYYLPAYRVAEFALGICLALALSRDDLPLWWTPPRALVTATLFLAGTVAVQIAYVHAVPGSSALPRPLASLLMLPAFVGLICAFAVSDLHGGVGWLRHRPLVRLGVWSFSLYLTHLLLLQAAGHVLGDWRPAGIAANVAVELLVITVCVLASAVAFTLVEKPAERLIRRGRARKD